MFRAALNRGLGQMAIPLFQENFRRNPLAGERFELIPMLRLKRIAQRWYPETMA
jgi:hypothetical protein